MEEPKLHISCRESSRVICLQVLPSYLLAGLGMVTAGMLLDCVQVSNTPADESKNYDSVVLYRVAAGLVQSDKAQNSFSSPKKSVESIVYVPHFTAGLN